ncbi:hypothetical protein [Roseateles sp.]|jgi:hypothetical protein|uniref:hypothetical protein n=1 Tax=Roseateles sp. TaxID=1971397 RepID=UPI0037C74042
MSLIDPPHCPSIRALASSPDYAAQALAAIVRVPLAPDPPQLLDRLMNATTALGATASVFTAAIPEDGREPSSFSLFACHPGFAQTQHSQGPMTHHPWFRFARSHSTPGTDQQMPCHLEADSASLDLARQYGFRSCLVIPTAGGVGRIEMLCLGSKHAEDFEGPEARLVRTLARSLAAELHDWLTVYLQRRLRENARLQDKDLDLLTLEWQGLGTKEISSRTGMSTASVNSRFQRINVRLQCSNRKASAKRAAAYGLLEST